MARKKPLPRSSSRSSVRSTARSSSLKKLDKNEELKGRRLTAFGERLVMALQSKGMNDSDLAKALGIAQPNIHTLKYKTDRPRSATVMKIAKTLGVAPEILQPGGALPIAGLGGRLGRDVVAGGTKVYLVIESKSGRQTVRLA